MHMRIDISGTQWIPLCGGASSRCWTNVCGLEDCGKFTGRHPAHEWKIREYIICRPRCESLLTYLLLDPASSVRAGFFLKKCPHEGGYRSLSFTCSFYRCFPGVGILHIRVTFSLALNWDLTSVSGLIEELIRFQLNWFWPIIRKKSPPVEGSWKTASFV